MNANVWAPDTGLIAALMTNARATPDREALVLARRNERALTYGELMARAAATAAMLDGLPHPERPIAIAGVSELDVVPALIGCLMANRLCFVYPPQHGPARLAQALRDSNPVAAIVDNAGREAIETGAGSGPASALETVIRFQDIQTRSIPAINPAPCPPAEAVGPSIAIFTSSSTGRARGAVISLADLSARVEAEYRWFGLRPGDTTLALLPIYFDVGLTQLLTTLALGGRHVYLETGWVGGDLSEAIAEYCPAGFAASPVIWSTLLKFGVTDSFWRRLADLRYVTISGGDLAPSIISEIAAKSGGSCLFKTYGQSEMFRIASLRPEEIATRPGSVGRAYPGASFAVLDDDDQPVPPNITGEIVAWGLGCMSGYLSGATGDGLSPAPTALGLKQDALIRRTGDHGYVDDDGYLYLHGRKDDMVKIMDQRVYLLEVERLVGDVIGITAFVVVEGLSRGGQTFLTLFHADPGLADDDAKVLRRIRDALPPHMAPRRIVAVPELPLLPSGKVDRASLRKLA